MCLEGLDTDRGECNLDVSHEYCIDEIQAIIYTSK